MRETDLRSITHWGWDVSEIFSSLPETPSFRLLCRQPRPYRSRNKVCHIKFPLFLAYLTMPYLDMAPQRWTTNEQEEFLVPWYKEYMETTMKKKQYSIFFANLSEEWFQRFPEQTALFGDTNIPLTKEQQLQLNAAVKKRKDVSTQMGIIMSYSPWHKQLKNRFKNLFGSSKVGWQSKAEANDAFKLVVDCMYEETEKGHRGYQEVEAYSKLYFKDRIKGAISEKLAATGEEIGKMSIQRIKEETHALYLSEPEDVKQKVREFAKTAKRESKRKIEAASGAQEIWASEINEKLVARVILLHQLTYHISSGTSKSWRPWSTSFWWHCRR